jgi:pimeloyl-ACP methyl ester carboxylesterase
LHYAVYRYSPDLNQFNKEALLLEADEDIYAGDVMTLHQNIPGSIYKKVPNSGSWQFFEEPELNASIIRDFIN